MKIDVFTHVIPPRFRKALEKYSDKFMVEKKMWDRRLTITDSELRIRLLEEYGDMVQVLSGTLPPLEEIVNPSEAVELARMANDGMAEWVAKHPKKFIAAIANL